jgi:hypothetical protein
MLINLTNHPSSSWAPAQREAAMSRYGEIVDLAFPSISPTASRADVAKLAQEYVSTCSALLPDPYSHRPGCPAVADGDCTCPRDAIHLMGETSFVLLFARAWGGVGDDDAPVPIVVSTTERVVEDIGGGQRKVTFTFVAFREL